MEKTPLKMYCKIIVAFIVVFILPFLFINCDNDKLLLDDGYYTYTYKTKINREEPMYFKVQNDKAYQYVYMTVTDSLSSTNLLLRINNNYSIYESVEGSFDIEKDKNFITFKHLEIDSTKTRSLMPLIDEAKKEGRSDREIKKIIEMSEFVQSQYIKLPEGYVDTLYIITEKEFVNAQLSQN